MACPTFYSQDCAARRTRCTNLLWYPLYTMVKMWWMMNGLRTTSCQRNNYEQEASPWWTQVDILLKVSGTPCAGIKSSERFDKVSHELFVLIWWLLWIPCSLIYVGGKYSDCKWSGMYQLIAGDASNDMNIIWIRRACGPTHHTVKQSPRRNTNLIFSRRTSCVSTRLFLSFLFLGSIHST